MLHTEILRDENGVYSGFETQCLCGLCGAICARVAPGYVDPHIDAYRANRSAHARNRVHYSGGLTPQRVSRALISENIYYDLPLDQETLPTKARRYWGEVPLPAHVPLNPDVVAQRVDPPPTARQSRGPAMAQTAKKKEMWLCVNSECDFEGVWNAVEPGNFEKTTQCVHCRQKGER